MAAAPVRECVRGHRCKYVRVGTLLDCSFRNGALLAAGTMLLTQGVLRASRSIDSHARESSLPWNGYLLQIYAGYFLLDLMLLLYCLSCLVWHAFGIDYAAMFSDNPRHYLDARDAAELPCWSFFFLGLTLEVNSHVMGSDTLHQNFPALLIGLSVLILFMPFRILYHESRMWLLNSLVSIDSNHDASLVAIPVNILLRFTWILYVAFPQQLQHSGFISFGVSIGEVFRRAIWSLFRIENEYCNLTSVKMVEEVLPHSSWPFLDIKSKKARRRSHKSTLERRYRSPIDSNRRFICRSCWILFTKPTRVFYNTTSVQSSTSAFSSPHLSMPSIPTKCKPEAAEEADTPFKRAQRTRKPTLKALFGDGSQPTQPIELPESTPDPPTEPPTQAIEPPTQAIELPTQAIEPVTG
ncbi:signal transduction protein [Stemphylium lycopersici]|uniref:Signal transduction protein n=1 Tax=Stemphylium lycopersici TaxID=183478 RepID=A0A364MRY1_STELY|nr:signal transduction protein [Stemphylium lycopersici]RAR01310.1 signal transduction protein [Stemphylium lycopersici]